MTSLHRSNWQHPQLSPSNRVNGYESFGSTGDRVAPLAFTSIYSSGPLVRDPTGGFKTTSAGYDALNSPPWGAPASDFPYARNKAYAKLVGAVRGQSSSIGTAAAEWRESLGMIEGRCLSLYSAYRDLRRGRFRSFLRDLRVNAKRKHRNKIRNLPSEVSSLWLEYSFGWKPFFQDIYSAMNVLSQPLPGGKFSGSGREGYSYSDDFDNEKVEGVAYVKQGAKVFLTNPNLYLAQELGIANPAQVAWELVPWSFAVDWVFDVSSFLGSFTDFIGCEVVDPYTTLFIRGVARFRSSRFVPFVVYKANFAYTKRVTGLSRPYPNFSVFNNLGTSLTRAANAASLLVQTLAR